MLSKAKVDLREIGLLVLDVDGVLTDGRFIVGPDGAESKAFHSLDGHGIRLWKRAGLEVALLSGRSCRATRHWAQELEIEHILEGCHVKLPALEELLGRLGLSLQQVAYVGDDLLDLPVIRCVGLGVAVADAVAEIKRYADYVTSRRGGEGAVREVIELILKGSGRWQGLMERYLA